MEICLGLGILACLSMVILVVHTVMEYFED